MGIKVIGSSELKLKLSLNATNEYVTLTGDQIFKYDKEGNY